jgi:polysaccharide biosynthesis/export protein
MMMMNMRITACVVLGGLLLGASARAQEPAKPEAAAPAGQKADSTPKPAVGADYKIGPQDVLRIDVWKEPEISRTIPVRPDGKISLPLLNDVQAAGLTSMELAGVIRDGLTKYITNPQVTVSVTEINSQRVYVTGEVLRPGALSMIPGMTVLQALSSSGGFTQFAKLKGIYVLRVIGAKQEKFPFNYKDVVAGRKPEQNIPLEPGDVIVVP